MNALRKGNFSQKAAAEEVGKLKLYTTPPAAAQPAQEPVCPKCKAGVLYECVACSSNNYPPQRTWVDLTDDEISDIAINNPPAVHEFARAVLATSKEKNT
jgi:hypothetical protein